MIRLVNITKIYQNNPGYKALNNVNLEFENHGMVFVLGKSGSGKSTLLNLMAGLDGVSAGEITVMGKKLPEELSFDDYRNNVLGFIFQEFNLNKALTVIENVLVSERFLNRPVDKTAAEKILSSVGLSGKGDKKINQLSGGEQQRTAIARALIKNPKIILADEPTGNLDENNGRIVFELLKELSKDRLVVIVSHDRASAEKYADRIIELSDGRVVSDKERNPDYNASATVDGNTVRLSKGGTITPEYAEFLNANRGKTVAFAKEERFRDTKTVRIEDSESGEIAVVKKMKFKNVLYLAWRNLLSRGGKTLLTVLLSTITFAVFGLSLIVTTYSEHTAASHTFKNNSEGEIAIYKGGYNEYGRFEANSGAPLGLENADYFKKNYADYARIIKLNGLAIGENSLLGAYEITETELSSFGFSLMNFENFTSRFPETSETVDGLPEVVITDYLAYLMYKMTDKGKEIPTDENGLKEFLNSGFEAELAKSLNTLATGIKNEWGVIVPPRNNFDNARLRVVGILDTGYKEKYFEYVLSEKEDYEKGWVNFMYDIENYYLMLYGADGLSANCYRDNLYSAANDVDFCRDNGYGSTEGVVYDLKDGEAMLTKNLFRKLFGYDFVPKENDGAEIAGGIGGVDLTGFKVRGVIDNTETNPFKTSFGVVFSETGFSYAVSELTYQTGARLTVESSQVQGLFDYMEKNGLYYASLYSRITAGASPTINSMRTIFIPIAAVSAMTAVVALAMFLITAVTKKQKDIGVWKALGVKTRDIDRVYIIEATVTLLLVAILSALLTFALYLMSDFILIDSMKRFLNSTMIEDITVLYLTWVPFVINLVSVLVVGVASVIYPTRKISKMQPIDAIKKV